MTLDGNWARRWVELSATSMAENRTELIHLDRNIGDGDHGENMDRGFQAALGKLSSLEADATPADVLKLLATTLISTVGGAAGPLYGTAFLKGAVALKGKPELEPADVAAFVEAASAGLQQRGKAQPGDKTMVDAWAPAASAASKAAAAGDDGAAVLRAAAFAAVEGAAATEPLIARKGRASYLGERSAGHRDPGAQSTAYLLGAAVEAAS
ncbi:MULTISPECIES: dihydroxyacetone kinase subunit DhaL [unclassified Pseudoclavibacter]|uniref:dihydroxyacetone kinase subunit DhaL n=1 Tax=unclassified Pseudoclavibacter TaxID=2615177 RepID=UPI000CE72B17|nr:MULTISPECIES: dihydroxyacetone kinase subunit DhaL [unclassified Pseudoclavibacter]MBF4548968.1 dihydroxyacetone kinase subunit L [Pseudoclavibacter sp. VKM Ac-2888]PPF40249.1 dihydroxyacetone kinase subunit L [Pseudoclavibacter sp. AY1H1]PPF75746.1 dihydroxyacetone kinase subunit L [Pseudoclavibacter sp. Z016]PPG02495.1 dihydroxyacetone kinase subunit L [Pseudoclavibacter sp. RFBI5]